MRVKWLLWVGIVCVAAQSAFSEQFLYVSTNNPKAITAYAVAPSTGDLSQQFQVTLPGNGGPMAFSPDRKFLYAAVTGLPEKRAGVVTLRRSKDGTWEVLKTVNITGRTAYIRTDRAGKFLLAAHYGDGEVTVYRIDEGVCTGQLSDRQATERTAHCVEMDPTGRFVFVPHTAPNKIFQFTFHAERGTLTPNQPPFAEGPDQLHRYHGPRHYVHHPKRAMAFTSNETGGGISSWKVDPTKGTLRLQQTLCTLPPGYEGASAAADIELTPDGRFAYVSNRDTRKQEQHADSLTAVAISPETGAMRIIGHYPTAHFPRSICIDVSGTFLFAAGQRSATLVSYRIDPSTGTLKQLRSYPTGQGPIWGMCAE